jgi:hypothetical protein
MAVTTSHPVARSTVAVIEYRCNRPELGDLLQL